MKGEIVKERLWKEDCERLWTKDCEIKIANERLWKNECKRMLVRKRSWDKDCEGKIVKWRLWKKRKVVKERLWKKDCKRKIVKGRLKDRLRAKGWKRKPAEIWKVIFDHFSLFFPTNANSVAGSKTCYINFSSPLFLPWLLSSLYHLRMQLTNIDCH